MRNINGYDLSRAWFDWCFENPERISPNHTALYFFIIEHCNRLGWKKKFGLPTTMAKEAIGIKSYNTYIKTLRELVAFGFVEMIEVSKNQYSSNIVALSKFNNAPNNALDKALIKHTSKQSESTCQSIDSIDKQRTKNKEQRTSNQTSKNSAESISSKFEINKDWAEVVFDWLDYKKERREAYKSDRCIKSFITKLRNLSANDPGIAKQIIEQSFAQSYAGVFELKNNNNEKTNRATADTIRREKILRAAEVAFGEE